MRYEIRENVLTTCESEWLKYWEENGNDIVNVSWIMTRSDYIDSFSKKFGKLSSDNLNNHYQFSCKIHQISKKWIKLWEKHYKEQYSKTFYDWFEKKNQNDSIADSDTDFDYVELDQSCELLNLGLPSSFGRSKTERFKKGKNAISSESSQHLTKRLCEFVEDNINKIYCVETNKSQEMCEEISLLKKRKPKNRHLRKLPSNILNDKRLHKYWKKRFTLFSKFEQGIQLDEEGWFSVTPEKIAIHISDKLSHLDIIVDGFCGCGGNSIQFAKRCQKVIAIDIDPKKILMAKNNAKIYNVENKIDFVVGDFFQLSKNLKADGVFLSPPWGGPNYKKKNLFDIEKDLQPAGASHLFNSARSISKNIALYLPRNSDIKQIVSLAGEGKQVEIEHNYFEDKVVALTAFFGELIPIEGHKKIEN